MYLQDKKVEMYRQLRRNKDEDQLQGLMDKLFEDLHIKRRSTNSNDKSDGGHVCIHEKDVLAAKLQNILSFKYGFDLN
jgi:hypothetical protein